MEIIQIVAVFYGRHSGCTSTLERRLEIYQGAFERVASKEPFRNIGKRVFVEEGIYIIQDKDSISGHTSETGIKFTFTPGDEVTDYITWKMEIDKLIDALIPELHCHRAMVAKTKAEIYLK